MKKKLLLLSAVSTILTLFFTQDGYNFSSGPNPGYTGAPGEDNCTFCHSGVVNSGPGMVSIMFPGGDTTYQSDSVYDVSVTVAESGVSRFGFQITVIDPDGNGTGAFIVTNSTITQIKNQAGRQYMEHTSAGNSGSNSRTWNFQWEAPPDSVGTVYFYAAGNATNSSGTNSGDHIYTTRDSLLYQPPPPPPPGTSFTISDSAICVGDATTFTDVSLTTPDTWNWNFGPGASPATANTQGPHTVTYSSAGVKIVTLTATFGNSTAVTKDTVFVYAPSANAGADLTICDGGSVQLNGSGGVTYAWSPSATLSDTTIANPIASPLDTTTYTVVVTNEGGCVNSDQVRVNVSDSLEVGVTADTAIGDCHTLELLATGGSIFTWSPATGLSATNIANPIASPGATTTYKVIISDGMCTDSATVTITVFPCPGVAERSRGSNWQMYPNPAKDRVRLVSDGVKGEKVVFLLTDLQGRTVREFSPQGNSSFTYTFDVSGILSGLYLMLIRQESGVQAKKLLIE